MTRVISTFLALAVALSLAAPASADGRGPGTPTSGGFATDRVIVAWRDAGRGEIAMAAHGLSRRAALGGPGAPDLLATNGRPVADVLAQLRRDPNVLYAEPDYLIGLPEASVSAVEVNDPMAASQYSLDRMRVRDAWSMTTGADNSVAVLDTGVQFDHPDLAGRLLSGWDFVNSDADASDDNGHGTWVSGIVAAAANDGYGVAGISWSDKILPVKIMNANGSGYTSTLVAGIRWAADHGAKVINMSIGGFPASDSVQAAVDYAWGKGAVLVGAAGNNRREETHYPASFEHVVSVSATQADDEFTNWSSYGPRVDVSAPGASVLTTNCEKARTASCAYYGSHITISGTSFATPNVAGVVALLWAKHPTWTPQQIVDRLIATVDDLGYAGWDRYYGHGRVNAYRALGASVAAPPIAAGDGLEPNNDLGRARRIALATLQQPTIHPAGDVDYFAVDVPRGGRLTVTVTAVTDTSRPVKSSLPVDPVVELLTTGGTRLALVDNPSDSSATEVAGVTLADATRVIVRISNWLPNGSRVPYTLRADYLDNAAPLVVARSPAHRATNVNRYVAPRVTFNEAVANVTARTLVLRNTATGQLVPASVQYDAATLAAVLTPAGVLDPLTRYRLVVRGGIHDPAGNAIVRTATSFTTGEHATYEIGASARVAFESGTFTGYRFTPGGGVTATRTYTLGRASGANASLAGTLPGQSGTWFYVANGIWAGYWVRQSPGAYLAGTRPPPSPGADRTYSPTVRLVFKKGTHTGYRFDANGRPTAEKTSTLGADSGANTSALRAIGGQYGRWFQVTNGIWAGYWISASDVVYRAP